MRVLIQSYQIVVVLLVLQEQVFRVPAFNLSAQGLRVSHGKQRRMCCRGNMDPEPVQKGEQLFGGFWHEALHNGRPVYFQLRAGTSVQQQFAVGTRRYLRRPAAPPITLFPCCIRNALRPYRRGLRLSAARAGVAQG